MATGGRQKPEICFAVAVEVNALARGALRWFTQWPWVEQTAFRGGHSTIALSPLAVEICDLVQNSQTKLLEH